MDKSRRDGKENTGVNQRLGGGGGAEREPSPEKRVQPGWGGGGHVHFKKARLKSESGQCSRLQPRPINNLFMTSDAWLG